VNRAEAEGALSEWAQGEAAIRNRRDPLVRSAAKAGVPVHRIHVLTGLGRGTVYRILNPSSRATHQCAICSVGIYQCGHDGDGKSYWLHVNGTLEYRNCYEDDDLTVASPF
jgi:hypothetical protein